MTTSSAPPGPPRLAARLGRTPTLTAISLDGVLDERNPLTAWITPIGEGTHLLIHLGHLTRINSIGVRDWVDWLRTLRERWDFITLFDCPPGIMNEINFVKNFAEGVRIATFQAPFICPKCAREATQLIPAYDLVGLPRPPLPDCLCASCGALCTLDDEEDTYLSFLETLPPVTDRAALLADVARAQDILAPAGPARALPLVAEASTPAARTGHVADIGHRSPPAPHLATSPPSPSLDAAPPARDWLFVAAITAMAVGLAFVVYLITTVD